MKSALAATLAISLFTGCASTGDPENPVRALDWREIVYGHSKYTPEELNYSRCIYRNRLPDGSRSGYQRMCRLKAAALFPMGGINTAMYASACKMEECSWLLRPDFFGEGNLTLTVNQTLTEQCAAIVLARMPEPRHSKICHDQEHWAWGDALAQVIRACLEGRIQKEQPASLVGDGLHESSVLDVQAEPAAGPKHAVHVAVAVAEKLAGKFVAIATSEPGDIRLTLTGTRFVTRPSAVGRIGKSNGGAQHQRQGQQ